ncbi:MAG: hypothetical protein IPH88_17305 [Bacteroidales bacterium]|nr:hypothetical protein [Bacteroidales bacterium]
MKKILITGDITRDHYFLIGKRIYSDSPGTLEGAGYSMINGGAGIIHNFLEAFTTGKAIKLGFNSSLFEKLPPQNKSYATIGQFKGGKDKKEVRMRVTEQFGFGTPAGSVDYAHSSPVVSLKGFDITIVDDAGMDFGSQTNRKTVWPWVSELDKGTRNKPHPGLVICKKSGNLKKGDLWKELLNLSKEGKINLVTIVSASDIRRQDARVSSRISWEQSALDLVYELKNNIALVGLTECRMLVVTFGSSGALVVSNKTTGVREYKLIFDACHLEGEWEAKAEGNMIGKMSCFTAAFAGSLDTSMPEKDFMVEEAIVKGLASIRGFYDVGFNLVNGEVRLPRETMVNAAESHILSFTTAYVPAPDNDPGFLDKPWSIMLDNHTETNDAGPGAMFELARRIITNGRQVLNNVPSIEFSKLFTVDRNEIEALRNIKILMENYRNQKSAKIPLSIAVFGLPGSGKSFSVKQIGKGVLGEKVPILEFNLSQFSGPADLIGAFHQVRDEILKGTTPLVFWDEFDSKSYDWLQYLLAPMQDGSFQEGQVTHTIGKCIMIFAGGTSYKMEFFGDFDNDKKKIEEFKLKKGPDFISRIHGYINILGPNPGLFKNKQTGKWEIDSGDHCFPIRRGLFIRQMFDLKDEELLDIDWGLLNAFLKVGKYKHGSRSLENLIKQLKENSDGRRILRSHLPSNAILKLLIDDIEDFFGLMNENMEYHEHTFEIAKWIHVEYLKNAKTRNPDYDTEFNMLPVFIKSSNLAAAIRIPQVLAQARLKIVHKDEPGIFTKEEYTDLINAPGKNLKEKMAEKEHQLWRAFYESNDWHYHEVRNDYEKLHNCLVDYKDTKLTEHDRDKDRNQVLKYWDFLNNAGFGIAKE